MKKDHEFLSRNSYKPILLNMSPKTGPRTAHPDSKFALIPGSSDWRKNLHCNALGAAITPGIDKVLHFAQSLSLPAPHGSKLEHTPHVDRAATLRLMSFSRVCLNVSLTECHPMVSIESEAMGTPCLRNPLLLDAHEDHPYVRLVEVADTASPIGISRTLKNVLAVGRAETIDMIKDYTERVNTTAAARYKEFLEL